MASIYFTQYLVRSYEDNGDLILEHNRNVIRIKNNNYVNHYEHIDTLLTDIYHVIGVDNVINITFNRTPTQEELDKLFSYRYSNLRRITYVGRGIKEHLNKYLEIGNIPFNCNIGRIN